MKLTFDPFENTLMHKDHTKIEQLRKFLTSNFDLPKFKNNYFKSVDSFLIRSGGISYPLSITFYYITEKEDQEELIHLIDEFFTNIPQKQRHIKFYESENWITEKDKIGIKSFKGEKKLLLEKIVK